jgi:hypothetical protein
LYLIYGSHRKVVFCDELGLNGLSAFIILPVDQKGVWITPNEFRILQASRNALDHGANICMLPLFFLLFFSYSGNLVEYYGSFTKAVGPQPHPITKSYSTWRVGL